MNATFVHPALRASHDLTESARKLLGSRTYAVVASENADGSPHLVPVMFDFADGRFYIETGSSTRKARNITARAHATVLVHAPEATWVCGSGPATIEAGADAVRHNQRIRAKYFTAAGEEACGDVLAALDDVTIIVTPTRWLAWDITMLLGHFAAHGADLDQMETWFHPVTD